MTDYEKMLKKALQLLNQGRTKDLRELLEDALTGVWRPLPEAQVWKTRDKSLELDFQEDEES